MTNIAHLTTPTSAAQTSADAQTAVRTLRTPYHALGELTRHDGTPRVPEWAQHRSVYRAAGRTLYLVETDRLDAAQHDLDALSRLGWQVRIDRDAGDLGDAASITLSRGDAAIVTNGRAAA